MDTLVTQLSAKDAQLSAKDAQLSAKDAQLGTKDAQLGSLTSLLSAKDAQLSAKDAQLLQALSDLRQREAFTHELEKSVTALLREKGIHSVRGALELLLDLHTSSSKEPELARYFSVPFGVGACVLSCCNAERKVLTDHGGKPHTAESLASVLFSIKRRLNKDSHDGRTGEEYERDGDFIVLRRNGLTESDVAVLRCLFEKHGYPIREKA